MKNYLARYFSLTDYLVSQEEAEQAIRDGVTFRGTNILILIFLCFLAPKSAGSN